MRKINRRNGLKLIVVGTAAAGCKSPAKEEQPTVKEARLQLDPNVVQGTVKLRFPWQTRDPFLFCVHHEDLYPAGNANHGPAASLGGRNLGQDFTVKDGWRMYHGQSVPGFPSHPHRGFETVTVVKKGLIDHADSLGAAARYGDGDTQWLTAGAGIQHAEMFPLLRKDAGNPTDFFQIWLNLPAAKKMVDPHFTMLWGPSIPVVTTKDELGNETTVRVIAGSYAGRKPPSPPPNSYASDPQAEVAIWPISMTAGASWRLPAAKPGLNRSLYFFKGQRLTINGTAIPLGHRVDLASDKVAELVVDGAAELLLLEGRPIGEPVAQHGPFVMNTREEVAQAYADYRRTRFGGWPWPASDPVHGPKLERFARRADGSVERPG